MPKSNTHQQTPGSHSLPSGTAPLPMEAPPAGACRLDAAIANCSRLLLDSAPSELAVPRALADLVRGLGASHAVLFQIKSYHTEDYRGQWLTCSAAEACPCCRESREWDYLRLIDGDVRANLEAGCTCRLGMGRLLPDFQQIFAERGVQELLLIPLTVMGQWWGGLCIERTRSGAADELRATPDLTTLAALFSIYFERRQAVKGCQERDKLSGALEMAGTVCHKLNQPMQVILGYASMVTSGDIRDPDQVGEIVQLIEDETRQMGIITKNLMGITKNRSAG